MVVELNKKLILDYMEGYRIAGFSLEFLGEMGKVYPYSAVCML